MTMPTIPDRPDITPVEAITDIVESIALEEVALAHLINAEAEKVQALVCHLGGADCSRQRNPNVSLDDVLDFQKGVSGVLQNAIKVQMLLQFKLENVLDIITKLHCNNNCRK